jgi:tetratricopeptide (TPR) repeat protein
MGNGEHLVREAEALADAGDYEQAVEVQRKALEEGFSGLPDGRQMLAWYLLRAGETAEGDELWKTLLDEAPDDADLHLTAGVAHLDAGRAAEAADLLGRALELALAGPVDAVALQEAVDERDAALEQAGREREAVDEHAAAALARLERQAEGTPIAVPWYPQDEYAKALERLPGFREDWGERAWADYSRELDARMRDVSSVHGHRPVPVPVRVDDLVSFASGAGLDPDWAETRARYADDHRDEGIAWPPGRNDPCWCGAGAKYKRHCGA